MELPPISKVLCWCCSQLGHEVVNLLWKIYHAVWDLWFSQQCCWRFKSSRTLAGEIIAYVSKECGDFAEIYFSPCMSSWHVQEQLYHLLYWRHVRFTTKTYVKKSFTISPISPKWCKDWPCTSHIALRRQALPSIPKLVSKSSTTIYRSALWKQKNTGNHTSV